jgi:cytochrome c oxidase assembly factor CtaG
MLPALVKLKCARKVTMNTLLITVALIAVEFVYLRGWFRLRSAIPRLLQVRRLIAFSCGSLVLWAVVASPLAAMDQHLLTAHMAGHLLLMTVSAPLILVGEPVMAMLNGLPKPVQRLVSRPFWCRSPLRTFGHIVTHPVFCWAAGVATVLAWHAPAMFELGMRSARLHEVEYGCFFVTGILFWWPVVQPWPSLATWSTWGVPLYLFLATLPCDALSAFLTFCDRVTYPHYLSMHAPFNISPLGDQECAGALMWVWVTFVYMGPAIVVTLRTLSPLRHTLNAEVV